MMKPSHSLEPTKSHELSMPSAPSRMEGLFKSVLDASALLVWMFVSTSLVFYNKYLMSYLLNEEGESFAFPISLTLWHMLVSSALASAFVWSGVVKGIDIPYDVYFTSVCPIAGCYAISLVLSNKAYQLTSVSFIQMVKAGLPVLVYSTGLFFGTERFNFSLAIDVVVIATGVVISAWGEANLVVLGLICVVLAIMAEAVRLTLAQKLMQQAAIKFNPITTLYYLAPTSAIFMAVPFVLMEMRQVTRYLASCRDVYHFGLNGLGAFGLNLAVFLVVGRTSALTLNVAGLVKDIGSIALSVVLYGSSLQPVQVLGYSISFAGVCFYNHIRRTMAAAAASAQPVPEAASKQQYNGTVSQQYGSAGRDVESENREPLLAAGKAGGAAYDVFGGGREDSAETVLTSPNTMLPVTHLRVSTTGGLTQRST